MQVVDLGHVNGLELPTMDDQQLIAGRMQLLDDGPTDEPGAAQDGDPHPAATCGFLSTMRSISPQSFACSGVMKKSRSMSHSTSSSGPLDCLACSLARCTR